MFTKGMKRLPNSGRRKGTPNKATVERRKAEAEGKVIQSKEMPLDYMLRVMRDPTQAPSERAVMARAAAQYCHPQLTAVAYKHMDAQGRPIAPVVSVRIVETPSPVLRLTMQGPKDDDKVQ